MEAQINGKPAITIIYLVVNYLDGRGRRKPEPVTSGSQISKIMKKISTDDQLTSQSCILLITPTAFTCLIFITFLNFRNMGQSDMRFNCSLSRGGKEISLKINHARKVCIDNCLSKNKIITIQHEYLHL